MEKTVLSQSEYRSKAARYCALVEHCEAEVRTKLYQWSCPEAWHDEIIDYLYEQNYLNDERYCAAFVHDQVAYQGWGQMKIRAALTARHLSSASIDRAMRNIDFTEYDRHLTRLIEQKKGTERDKLIRYLLQRGFTMDEILPRIA